MNTPPTYSLDQEAQFSILFDKHYQRLYNYAYKLLNDIYTSEEFVQETFIKLWEHYHKIDKSHRAIESFLIVTLKNKIIDHFRKNQTREKHNNLYSLYSDILTETNTQWDLLQQIDIIYENLEQKTRDIFQLSRNEGLTYKEISVKKNISIKTVELHISTALIAFRKGLKEYL
ncbi:RNA polymerase sigma-70 factor (ECF subfamily) [Algoriphagus sp. 4150]|uniref:sigma-70 family RNA polymerase sigma factor n=1 Tax=Algoriphagus sp. 4150 TaxID=2817756 RepID=UPI00285DAB06|nr:sigma-70 family RNA polymerase sigma factor [Algoriphagus sp. 4150]MDR7128006.1 RNA polymerase sigma-70 factor (ECF subfamily) [Algoriphagus sp. 4150]